MDQDPEGCVSSTGGVLGVTKSNMDLCIEVGLVAPHKVTCGGGTLSIVHVACVCHMLLGFHSTM